MTLNFNTWQTYLALSGTIWNPVYPVESVIRYIRYYLGIRYPVEFVILVYPESGKKSVSGTSLS